MARVLTATHEYEVQATIEYTLRNLGACCPALPSIVAAGRNSTTLHCETNDDPIVRGGLLLTDLGAEVDGYSADVMRTYPAGGAFSREQRAIYDAVLAAQTRSAAADAVRAASSSRSTSARRKSSAAGSCQLGLVTKNVRDDGRGEAVEWVRARP
jgi:Xaa-Pro aminopeptidase